MLVQFMLKNVLSFKEETILDMTAINAYKEHKENLIELDNCKDKFVRVASIYGANASGKSNLYCAMMYFQRILNESLNNVKEDEDTAIKEYYVPFSFDTDNSNSEFQIIEIVDGCEYKYGFEYNAELIVSEWLYRKKLETNRTTTIFERTSDNVNFGASVRKACDAYKTQVPKETLVLSFLNKLNLKVDVFKTVFSSIMDTLIVEASFGENQKMINEFLPRIIDENKSDLLRFLAAIDTGIKDIQYEMIDDKVRFITYHSGSNGEMYPLDFYAESQGTIKSTGIFIFARAAIITNRSIFVDELNVKLHPLLLKFIIDLFYNETSSAQLIYTTHDTTLLSKSFFRRDQIWFVQKDDFGYSELSALAEFKIRSDASFEKDYLAGVYGGIPNLKDFAFKEGE